MPEKPRGSSIGRHESGESGESGSGLANNHHKWTSKDKPAYLLLKRSIPPKGNLGPTEMAIILQERFPKQPAWSRSDVDCALRDPSSQGSVPDNLRNQWDSVDVSKDEIPRRRLGFKRHGDPPFDNSRPPCYN